MAAVALRLDDDEQVRMTAGERAVWASLVAVVVASAAYLALLVPRVLSQPVAEISWVDPMLWTIGSAVVSAVVLAIVLTVAVEVGRRGRCAPADHSGVLSDVRDREIGQLGGRASMGVISVGLGGALVLAMLDAHTFWIGNLLFLSGAAGAVVQAATKIRLYRRGFE
jgi:hypothetical protein